MSTYGCNPPVALTTLTRHRTERASHPVGTTVKVADFFKSLPIRKQTALKHSTKWLAKSKRLMQAYALARPSVRFSLKVLKAKTNRGDFIYAPKPSASVEDAAFKVIGKDCAGQCGWTTMETDGFIVYAFLPKPAANPAKLASEGAFLSIDARPVSTTRGTPKKIVTAFKEKLRRANPACASVKDPFFCMNIICPYDSYDPNIEPAKDDVLFGNEQLVVSVVEKLLNTYYPEAVDDVAEEDISSSSSAAQQSQQWRSNMYGIDEEDMELVSDNASQVLEDEEELRKAAAASNPWTIARLNASISPRKRAENIQLMTPVKGRGDVGVSSSYPTCEHISQIVPTVEPLTPQSATRSNMTRYATDISLQRSIRHVPPPQRSGHDVASLQEELDDEVALLQARQQPSAPPSLIKGSAPFTLGRSHRPPAPPSETTESEYFAPGPINRQGTPLNMILERSYAPRRGIRRQQPFSNKTFRPPKQNNDHQNWMGNNASVAPRQKKSRNRDRAPPPFQTNDPASPRKGLFLNAAKNILDNTLYSDNNTNIRDFFGTDELPQQGREEPQHRSMSASASPGFSSAFTPVNPRSRNMRDDTMLSKTRGKSVDPKDMAEQFRAYEDRDTHSSRFIFRSHSVEVRARSRNIRDQLCLHNDRGGSLELRNIEEQRQTCAEREVPHSTDLSPSQSASAEPFPRPKNVGDQLRIDGDQGGVPEARDSEAYINCATPVQQRCMNPLWKDVLVIETSNDTLVNSTSNGRTETRKIEKARRRSKLTHLRSKSSKLPRECVPYVYRIKGLILPLSIPNAAFANKTPLFNYFTNRMRNLNMGIGGNGLDWGYAAPTADDEGTENGFGGRVEESRVAEWCRLLGSWFETKDGRDSVGVMMEGVWSALRIREMDGDEEMDEVVEFEDPNTVVANVEMVDGIDYALGIETANKNVTGNVNARTEEEEEQYGTIDEDAEMLMTG
jgi:DNA mismatch repair ATPase MutL